MGMEQQVSFRGGAVPSWTQVRDLLASRGFPADMRMIDGELAFPDEMPPETWRELRLGTPQGMVTARRESDHVLLVTWGNADQAMVQAWNALTWAFAEAGGGRVLHEGGEWSADEFREHADLPAPFKRH